MAVIGRNVLIGYFLLVNLVAFGTMWLDKRKAKKGKWRIPERTLFIQAAIGGSMGALAGMYVFRHKTKHRKFVIGMPVILICHILIAVVVVYLKMK